MTKLVQIFLKKKSLVLKISWVFSFLVDFIWPDIFLHWWLPFEEGMSEDQNWTIPTA